MNSRERVETALNFGQPDRVPVFASFVPEIEQRLRSEFGISDVDVGVVLGNDMEAWQQRGQRCATSACGVAGVGCCGKGSACWS